jgi:hypothetical protein
MTTKIGCRAEPVAPLSGGSPRLARAIVARPNASPSAAQGSRANDCDDRAPKAQRGGPRLAKQIEQKSTHHSPANSQCDIERETFARIDELAANDSGKQTNNNPADYVQMRCSRGHDFRVRFFLMRRPDYAVNDQAGRDRLLLWLTSAAHSHAAALGNSLMESAFGRSRASCEGVSCKGACRRPSLPRS